MNNIGISNLNNNSIAKRDDYRRLVESGEEKPDAFQRYKHKFPYFGFVDCTAGDVEFTMFSANGTMSSPGNISGPAATKTRSLRSGCGCAAVRT